MRHILLLLLCFFAFETAISQHIPTTTTTELNKAASDNYIRHQNVLNRIYLKILEEFKEDTTFIKNFKRAQLMWYRFRDAQLEAKFPEELANKQGTMRTTCYLEYKGYLTDQRTKELEANIISREGDVCR